MAGPPSKLPPLCEGDIDPDPFQQFCAWYRAAESAGLAQPEAMTLATATPEGRPSARVVLLRGYSEKGLVFYTNYASRKGRELTDNPWAALVFFWQALDRQVRIEGRVRPVSTEQSEAYFRSRPRASQLGAWASEQSEVLPDRPALERRLEEMQRRFEGVEVPRPPYWGGYCLAPEVYEFWQGREGRLHDRICYRRHATGWQVVRLAP